MSEKLRERARTKPDQTQSGNVAAGAPAAGDLKVFEADQADAGERLDRFLSRNAADFSRTRLKALIQTGKVAVNGGAATDPSMRVAAGDRVRLERPPPEDWSVVGEDLPLDVVFEDEHLIVVDKPAGLVVHPAPGHVSGTLVNALIAHCGASLSGIGGVRRPGIVHRLDKDTSGLLVAAKTDAAHRRLAELFADHGREGSLVREYLALVWGDFPAPAGKVEVAVARHPVHRERMAVASEERGRRAVTHFEVVEALGAATLVRCRLETGRTHQIRVHMASIGHALLGDSVYGAGFKTKAARLPEAARAALATLRRQALHAAVLGFEHPATGEVFRFESQPPQDFASLLKAMRPGAKV